VVESSVDTKATVRTEDQMPVAAQTLGDVSVVVTPYYLSEPRVLDAS